MGNFFIDYTEAAVGLPSFGKAQDIGVFIGDVYSFSITVVGIVIFVRFIMAGWLYLTAAGNSANVNRAKSVMTNAIAGAVILFSAYLILYVINPDLVCNAFNLDVLNPAQSQVRSDCP